MPEAKPRSLENYRKSDGRRPFRSWYQQLDEKDPFAATRVSKYLTRLEQGNFSNAKLLPGCEGVWELVIDFGPGYRVYFAQAGAVIVLLLLGGMKRGQQKDIETAVEYWRDFKNRTKGEMI